MRATCSLGSETPGTGERDGGSRFLVLPPNVAASSVAEESYLGQPRDTKTHGRPISAPRTYTTAVVPTPRSRRGVGEGATMRDAQAGVPSARRLGAQLAFKDSMVHGILQFTPCIAFRYVLHRCESRDIRCRESFFDNNERRHCCRRAHRLRGGRSTLSR